MNEIVKMYIPLVDFIADSLGPNHEVVLHDVTNINESIVAIRNGEITGRKVGGPLTDLSFKLIKENAQSNKDYVYNFGKTKNGKRMKGSTYFIKDSNGKIVGMLGINTDISLYIDLQEQLRKFIGIEINAEKEEVDENFSSSIEEIMEDMIAEVIGNLQVPVDRMDHVEKMEVVQTLSEKGVFLIKGSVGRVAEYLQTSEATLYRYINKVNK